MPVPLFSISFIAFTFLHFHTLISYIFRHLSQFTVPPPFHTEIYEAYIHRGVISGAAEEAEKVF